LSWRPTRTACRVPGAQGSRRCRRLPAWRSRSCKSRNCALREADSKTSRPTASSTVSSLRVTLRNSLVTRRRVSPIGENGGPPGWLIDASSLTRLYGFARPLKQFDAADAAGERRLERLLIDAAGPT
jgi:hypothetical protein